MVGRSHRHHGEECERLFPASFPKAEERTNPFSHSPEGQNEVVGHLRKLLTAPRGEGALEGTGCWWKVPPTRCSPVGPVIQAGGCGGPGMPCIGARLFRLVFRGCDSLLLSRWNLLHRGLRGLCKRGGRNNDLKGLFPPFPSFDRVAP